ncbi:MAG: ATP-binding protein, partial [Oscillospiraceae bacterium]
MEIPTQSPTDILPLVEQRLALLTEQTAGTPPERAAAFAGCLRQERSYQKQCEALVAAGGAAPLEYLLHALSLTDFQRLCVYLALAVELDGSYERRFADLQDNRGRLPTLELCLRCFTPEPEERAALLGQWRSQREGLAFFFRTLEQQTEVQGELTLGLKLERRIVDFVLDYTGSNPALEDRIQLTWPRESLPPLLLYKEVFSHMMACSGQTDAPLLFYLQGEAGAGRHTLAQHFCQAVKRPLLMADIAALLQEPHWETAVRAICREAVICNALLGFSGFELLQQTEETPSVSEDETLMARATRTEGGALYLRILLKHAARLSPILFLCSTKAWQPGEPCDPYRRVEIALPTPDTDGRILLWTHALDGLALAEDVRPNGLAVKFALTPGQIAHAAQDAKRLAVWEGTGQLTDDLLHRACRAQLSHGLGKMASRVNAAYTWEDLILLPEAKRQLKNACDQVEYRHQVYDKWGFGKKVAYGRGLSILFTGPPGTGKTMAAQVLASRLQLELYKVDLSGVLSKYIGETEKQLGAVFDEVKKSQSILFFDEADALFGKRSETKDANDRYANV